MLFSFSRDRFRRGGPGPESDPDSANNEDVSEIEVAELTIPTLNQIGLVLLVSALGLGRFLVLRARVGA